MLQKTAEMHKSGHKRKMGDWKHMTLLKNKTELTGKGKGIQ